MVEVILFHVLEETRPVGQIRGYGFYNILSGFLFGLGFMIAGSCVLGTLYKLGEGLLANIFIPVGWIIGMAFVVYVVNPYLSDVYDVKTPLLPELMKLDTWTAVLSLFVVAAVWAYYIYKE